MSRILQPKIGSIVYHVNKKRDVYILNGQYESNGRISNHWEYAEVLDDGELGPRESGYGNFEDSKHEYEIQVVTKILKKEKIDG